MYIFGEINQIASILAKAQLYFFVAVFPVSEK